MATLTARPLKGPAAWHGRDLERLLLRLWLSMPNSRLLFEVLWGSIEPGALRGGIAQPRSA